MKFRFLVCSLALPTINGTSADVSVESDDEELAAIFAPASSVENPTTAPSDAAQFPVNVAPGIVVTGTTERGRVVEWYNTTFISEKINSDAAAKIAHQIKSDIQYDLFTPDTGSPDLTGGPPVWTEYTPLGEIVLGKRLYRGVESVIYEIENVEGYLIKYQANCDEIRDGIDLNEPIIHPLLTDYWYSSESFPVSSKVVFVSPPAFLCRGRIGKCDFALSEPEFSQCFENWGTVRFMIMVKENGTDLHSARSQYRDGIVPFPKVMLIGTRLFKILENLHLNARIVHGDIHAANLLMVPLKPGLRTLKLIDYGRAFRLTRKSNSQRYPANRFRHFLFTHWQAQGFEWGARDDLMKGLQLLAQLMNPWSYMDFEKALERNGSASLQMFKRAGFIFVQSGLLKNQTPYDPIERLEIHNVAKNYIRIQLREILDHVRGLNDINIVPQYKTIYEKLEVCKKLAEKELVISQLVPRPPAIIDANTTTTTSLPH